MKLLKRVLISITRRKVATLVLLLVTFMLGNVMFVSLSIKQSSEKVKDHLMQSIGAKVTLLGDMNDELAVTMMHEGEYERKFNEYLDAYEKIKKNSYVVYSDINFEFRELSLKNSKAYSISNKDGYDEYPNDDALLHEIDSADLVDEKENKIKLTEGILFSSSQMENGENVVLVSSHLKYKKETLKPHDKITFLMKDKNGKQEEIDYTVTGIFTPLENKYSDITKDIPYFYVPNQNIVYLSNKYIENSPTEFGMNRGRIYLQSNLICVNEPKNLEAFTNYAKEILEGSEITFETTEDSVSEILKPVENFASMSKNIV